MDSVGLAKAISSYWTEQYPQSAGAPAANEQLPLISVAGVQRRIKRALSRRSARPWLLKLG